MQTTHWTANSANLIIARNCIKFIEQEFKIKLRLSDPDFFKNIGYYAKQTTSNRTLMLASKLAHAAGLKEPWQHPSDPIISARQTIVRPAQKSAAPPPENIENHIKYRGKHYSRFNDQGQEFKGLYRGQPRYA